MTDIFDFTQGNSPLLINIPHAGEILPDDISARLTPTGKSIIDTDWYVDRLYPFAADLGASVLKAHYNRYCIDLNRAPDDIDLYPGQVKTGLCPAQSFDGDDLYNEGQTPSPDEIQQRVEKYWRPYHDKIASELARIKAEFGYALLFDAHSIRTHVPRLFDGALPDLNIGTNYGETCAFDLEAQAFAAAQNSPYDSVLNGRFVGGYITRNYGQPADDVHAIQMELTWDLYMDEASHQFDGSKAKRLSNTLHDIILAFIEAAKNRYK